jgi:hypothetical protein
MSTETPRPRSRRPTWAIHSAAGVRYPGGDGPEWWTTSAPDDVAPDPADGCTGAIPIYSEDCRATPGPTP